jgi:uncharacterized protein YhfF
MLTTNSPDIEAFWAMSCARWGIDPAAPRHAYTFGDPRWASLPLRSITDLVFRRKKTATVHLLLEFEKKKVPLRKAGDYWILLDADLSPLVLLRLTEVEIKPFNRVDEAFARLESEDEAAGADARGLGLLDYWTVVHKRYFLKQCNDWGVPWDDEIRCVFEKFTPYL